MIDPVLNRIAELLTSDQLVFYVGPDLKASATGAPGWPELAKRLADRAGYDATQDWLEVASRYEGQFAKQDLIDWLVDQLSGKKPGPLYEALAALPAQTYISAAYDDLLQTALRNAGRRVKSIVEPRDLNFLRGDRSIVVKLLGEVETGRERWSSLLMNAREVQGLLQYQDRILKQAVFPYFTGKSVVIIGQNLNAGFFQNLYYQSSPQDSSLRRRAYAVWKGLEEWERERWASSQLTIIEADPLVFLQQLLAASGSATESVTPFEPDRSLENEKETAPTGERQKETERIEVTGQLLRALRDVFVDHFNEEELRDFAFDLGVDYESLPRGGKRTKARELTNFMKRHNKIADLANVGEEARPDIPWRQILAEHGVFV